MKPARAGQNTACVCVLCVHTPTHTSFCGVHVRSASVSHPMSVHTHEHTIYKYCIIRSQRQSDIDELAGLVGRHVRHELPAFAFRFTGGALSLSAGNLEDGNDDDYDDDDHAGDLCNAL